MAFFSAELGDQFRLAMITMSANSDPKLSVYLAAKAALILVILTGILAGILLSVCIPNEWLQRIVAFAFIAIGVSMFRGKH